jgi:hypothetical protein
MEPERRREILHDMLAVTEATPADIAGPKRLTIPEMATLARIECDLANDLATAMEVGMLTTAVEDGDLAERGGGWRYPNADEQRGEEAAAMWAAFDASKSW